MNYVSTPHTSVHRQSVCVTHSLALFKNLRPFVRAALGSWSRYTSLIVRFAVHLLYIRLFLMAWQPVTCIGLGSGVVADILIAVSMCIFLSHKRTGFARRVHFPFPPIFATDLAELRAQNRFHDHDLDYLQCQLGFDDKVRS